MILHIFNFYSTLSLRNAAIKRLLELKEFQVHKYRSLAKESERGCYISCSILAILITLSFFIFHPMFGRLQDSPAHYYRRLLEQYNLFIHIPIFIFMILISYFTLFSLLHAFYRAWGMEILFYRLKEYIERHLNKKYYNLNIIDSKSEQDIIYLHLKRCVKFHLLLKRWVNNIIFRPFIYNKWKNNNLFL